jgi:uncharacterized membrane protein HdeD (DUF308 family)
MSDDRTDRSIRFAAFVVGGAIFLTFGIQALVEGVISLIEECTNSQFGGQCSGSQLWESLAPVIAGVVLAVLAILFFVFAYNARHPVPVKIPSTHPPP